MTVSKALFLANEWLAAGFTCSPRAQVRSLIGPFPPTKNEQETPGLVGLTVLWLGYYLVSTVCLEYYVLSTVCLEYCLE